MQPSIQAGAWRTLAERLRQLSFREQLVVLLQASRHLPNREKMAIRRTAGLRVLKAHVFPVLLRMLLEHVLKAILASGVSVIIVLICLLLLAWIDQINARAVLPVLVGVVALAAGFVISEIVEVWEEIHSYIRKTVSREERNALLQAVEALNEEEKVIVLRGMSVTLSRRETGNPIVAILLTWPAMLLAAGLLIGLILLVSALLPPLAGLPAALLLIVMATLAFLAGLLIPRFVQSRLTARKHSTPVAGRPPEVPLK
ncbi:MAG: hypothetical protein M3Z08_14130 [Chloroflexota bacterium]|nr:hypothetical protein [Chloroflexota bacterium]